MANSKEKLKRRIVNTLTETATGQKHTRQSLERIGDDVLELFEKRVKSPENQKRQVWVEGEARILRKLRRHEVSRAKHAVARGRS